MVLYQRLRNASVFKKVPITANGGGLSMNDILAMLFHRATATMYLVYAAWAIVSLIVGLPTVREAQGLNWQIIFSIAVLLTCAPACAGATFWPAMARTELFAGSSFVAGMLVYLVFTIQRAVTEGTWAGPVLILAVIVIPTARTVIIVIFLMIQADARKVAEKAAAAALREGGTDVRGTA